MDFLRAFFVVLIAFVGFFVYQYNKYQSEEYRLPTNDWYDEDVRRADDPNIVPFKVNVSDDAIQDLKFRLRNARITHQALDDANNFEYGFNANYLRFITSYWLNTYNWRFYEAIINTLPQYTTEIDGIQVHFIHSKPPNLMYKNVLPLLIIHGWPGNVFEFYKIIPMLNNPVEQLGTDVDLAFEVIAPSIPGYAWSAAPRRKGFNGEVAARVFQKLMLKLGFKKFLTQGGDWGSFITTAIALHYPENVIGLHINMASVMNFRAIFYYLIGSFIPSLIFESTDSNHEWSVMNFTKFIFQESGYFHIQATKPDTVGVALNDSPIGLAAYILEKFSTGTNPDHIFLPDGGLTKKFTMDELLTIVSIYWFQGNMLTSQRFYKENLQLSAATFGQHTNVPTGYAVFPNEITQIPEIVMKTMFNITSYTKLSSGGHFAALEEPKLLANDIIQFVRKINNY